MENQISEDNYRVLARERSHEEARQTVATSRMLVQTLVIINGIAAVAILAFYATRTGGNSDRPMLLLANILFSSGIFAAIFAGLYIKRASQESALFWELKSYQDAAHQHETEKHLRQMVRSKRWLTGLLIVSEIFFLAGCLASAVSLS